MPGFYLANGKFYREDQPSVFPDNRSFRYGDGLFETLRVAHSQIPLWHWHIQRLFAGIQTLQFHIPAHFTAETLFREVMDLCKKNHLAHARVRITVSRGEGGILEPDNTSLHYIIQTWPLEDPLPALNSNGLQLVSFHGGIKAADPLSHLKSTNYLVYAMAARFAKEARANDAIILNQHGRIADLSIANIYWTKAGNIYTTPLSEGPVGGVMRSYLKEKLPIQEQPLLPQGLAGADEIFITNAVRGIQWVSSVDQHRFAACNTSADIYHSLVVPIFSV